MSKLKYHQTFTQFTTLALLHLYCYLDITSRFVPIKKRNELLIKLLKKQITLPGNAIIKKDLKTLIMIARKGQNLEVKLWALHKVNCEYGDKFTDADHLFILFTYLHEQHGFESTTIHCLENERKQGVIYANKESIDACFSEDNVLIASLPVFVITVNPSVFVALVNNHGGMFIAEYMSTADNGCVTFLLHKRAVI